MRKLSKKIIALIVCTALVFASGVALIVNGLNKIINAPDNYVEAFLEEEGFINGILIPWFDVEAYGHDIGPNPNVERYNSDGFNEAMVRATLWNCKTMGFNMVKIWISCNMQGMCIDKDGHVTGIDSIYLKNLKTIFDIGEEYGLNLAITLHPHLDSEESDSLEYTRRTYFIQNPSVTQEYLKNWLNPILKLVGNYENIMMIDIYGEPEGDTDGSPWGLNRGVSWEGMIRFHNTVSAYIKDFDPKMTVTTSSGSYYDTLTKYFNQMDLDYYGCDIYYDDVSQLKDPKSLKLKKPLLMGEYGANSTDGSLSDVQRIRLAAEYIDTAKELGYAGMFLWNPVGHVGEGMEIYNSDSSFRETATIYRFRHLDEAYEKFGYQEIDKPAMIATVDQEFVSWFGSRDADYYILERSSNGKKWSKIAEVDSGDEYSSYLFKYYDKTAEQGVPYYYRVTTVLGNDKVTSDIGPTYTMKKIRCNEDENLVSNYSFETGDFTHYRTNNGMVPIETVAEIEKDNANHGNYALHFKNIGAPSWALVAQDLNLEPNTKYVFTVYYKAVETGTNGHAFVDITENGEKLFGKTWDGMLRLNFNNEWSYITTTFTTRENSQYRLYIPDCGGDYYIDDIYVFKDES